MSFKKTLRAMSGAALAGALVLVSAPAASADQVREDQWPLKAFDAEAIWKISKGKGVTVAVIDDGVNAQHVDLVGNVTEGKDFIDGGSTVPDYGDAHGTEMASLIAGHGHGSGSSAGVMGLAPEAKILSIRDDGTSGGDGGAAIRYAVDQGASVINISMAGPHINAGESAAVAYALKNDVLVVAGAGNDGADTPMYPASHPGVVAVGGVKNNAEIWEKSNYGPSILLTAPATNIVGAGSKTNTAYRSGTGTSDSTAFVSAAAALLRSKFPDLTAGQIVNRLAKTAGLPESAEGFSLPDEKYGYGFIQPLPALTEDIPAGSKYGPLSVPESLKEADALDSSDSSDDQAAADRKAILAWVGIGLVGLVFIGVVVLVIVRRSRRKKNNRSGHGGPGAPGGHGGSAYPPYGQPPSQPNPYRTPPQSAPTYQQPPSWGPQ